MITKPWRLSLSSVNFIGQVDPDGWKGEISWGVSRNASHKKLVKGIWIFLWHFMKETDLQMGIVPKFGELKCYYLKKLGWNKRK